MGATESTSNRNPVTLKTETKEIILHYSYKTMIKISQATTFPHGYEGLKTWDANVVMARFVLINLNRFKDKSVIEMCSGTGLAGVTLGKFTSSKKLTLTDLTDEVVGVIKNNCLKNEINEEKYIAYRLMWDEYVKFVSKYDIILVSDPFFHRCSPEMLTAVANHYLEPGGILYLSCPKSKSLEKFLKIAEETKFEVRKEKLNSYEYLSSPLLNQVDGEKEFPLVCAGDIDIYEIVKRPPIRGHHEEVNTIKELDRIEEIGLSTPKEEKESSEKIGEKREANEEKIENKGNRKEGLMQVADSKSEGKQEIEEKNNDKVNTEVEIEKHNQISSNQQTNNIQTLESNQHKTMEIIIQSQINEVGKASEETEENNVNKKNSIKEEEEVKMMAEEGLNTDKIPKQQTNSEIKEVHKEETELQLETEAKTENDTISGEAESEVSQIETGKLNEEGCDSKDEESKREVKEEENVKQEEEGEEKESEGKKKKKKNKKK